MISDLHGQASQFAQELTDTLNGTVAQHVRMRAALRPRSTAGAVFTAGHGTERGQLGRVAVAALVHLGERPRFGVEQALDLGRQMQAEHDAA